MLHQGFVDCARAIILLPLGVSRSCIIGHVVPLGYSTCIIGHVVPLGYSTFVYNWSRCTSRLLHVSV